MPVPDRLTVWGLPIALWVNVNVPVAELMVTGVKVTPRLQLPPPATLEPQVLLAMVNGPLIPTPLKVSAVVR
jgi:hypothetical protein